MIYLNQVRPDHLTSIKSIIVGAAPFGKALACKFLEKAPHVIFKEGMFEQYCNIFFEQHYKSSRLLPFIFIKSGYVF